MSSTAKGSLDAGGAGVPRCPQCKQYSTRREWFAPQWRHGRAVVLGQQGGDYVCCKHCYYGGLMVLHSDNPTTTREDANARALCHHMSTLAQIMLAHVDFVENCMANPAAIREFESKRLGGMHARGRSYLASLHARRNVATELELCMLMSGTSYVRDLA